MPPKTKFTKEQIIDTAFEIAKEEGLDSITIRKVAQKMGGSIAPIYVNFQTVDDLIEAVVAKIFTLPAQLLAKVNTGSPFHDIGVASLLFAKDYSLLFRDMVMKNNKYAKPNNPEVDKMLVGEMKKDPQLAGLSEEELMNLLLKMRIFQMGLSVMVANQLLPEAFQREDKMIELLDNTSSDLILATKLRKEEN